MKKAYLIIALLVLSITANSQVVPCVDGMAGDYPCCGYDMVSHFTLDELGIVANVNDSWGWTDPLTNIEYAIVGGRNRAVFIDLSDPVNPIFVGYVSAATSGSLWRDIKVYNNYAFIVSEAGGHGMQVFDLTRLRDVASPPMQFDADVWFTDFGHAHNIAINEETGYAYVIGANTYDGGPHFINIQDPLNPVTEGGFDGDGYSHDGHIIVYNGPDTEHVGKELYFGFHENSLTIVDVTDKTDPTMLSRTEYGETGYTHQGWVNEDHTIAYMNDEIDEINFGFNTRTLIMDIEDLDNPVLLEEYYGETAATDHNMYVKGDKLYEANYQAGMRVLQISDTPGNRLDEVGYFDVYPSDNSNSSSGWLGSWSVYPYFESGNIVISSIDEGFFLVHSSENANCAVGVEELKQIQFSLFPNPASSSLNIVLDDDLKLFSIKVVDLRGRVLFSDNSSTNNGLEHKLDVSNLTSGIYFLSINDISVQKFVVE